MPFLDKKCFQVTLITDPSSSNANFSIPPFRQGKRKHPFFLSDGKSNMCSLQTIKSDQARCKGVDKKVAIPCNFPSQRERRHSSVCFVQLSKSHVAHQVCHGCSSSTPLVRPLSSLEPHMFSPISGALLVVFSPL